MKNFKRHTANTTIVFKNGKKMKLYETEDDVLNYVESSQEGNSYWAFTQIYFFGFKIRSISVDLAEVLYFYSNQDDEEL